MLYTKVPKLSKLISSILALNHLSTCLNKVILSYRSKYLLLFFFFVILSSTCCGVWFCRRLIMVRLCCLGTTMNNSKSKT